MKALLPLFYKCLFFLHPAYRRTGGKVRYIREDLQFVKVEIPLNWRTKNYVGTLFGGSMYGACDPIYMMMLIKLLGKEYIVWDKAASIKFIKPGKSALTAHFEITDEELQTIKKILEEEPKCERTYEVFLKDKEGVLCAKVEKLLYIAPRKNPDKN